MVTAATIFWRRLARMLDGQRSGRTNDDHARYSRKLTALAEEFEAKAKAAEASYAEPSICSATAWTSTSLVTPGDEGDGDS